MSTAPSPNTEAAPWRCSPLLPDVRERTFGDALHELAAAVPTRVAVHDGDRRVTYRELVQYTDAVARAVSAPRGAPPVTVIAGADLASLVMTFGTMAGGRATVPVNAASP
ncbi:MAG TPA: hypothetical protein VEP49_07050, partial [Acidimicrobiia bacterium]|nr:hypothetical protein [Acidimicrobiia bacterium]